MITGLGSQVTAWDERLYRRLADEGFHGVRYDNRDAALSTFLDAGPQPDLGAVLDGDGSGATYLLADLADDAGGLLGVLSVECAHLVGASMGGMIAQQVVIAPRAGAQPVLDHVLDQLPEGRAAERRGVGRADAPARGGTRGRHRGQCGVGAAIGSPGYPREEQELRASVIRAYDRCSRPTA